MHIAIILGITFLAIFIVVRLLNHFSSQIKFMATGLDQKFSMSEIISLWRLAKICNLDEPSTLYYSVPALSTCIATIIERAEEEHTQDTPQVQMFLAKLYKYRTRIELEADQKRGLDTTKDLSKGQRLRIIFPGRGLHESEILNCGRDLTIKVPTQKGIKKIPGDEWVSKDINVYLWRKGDASYVFDSRVLASGVFNGQSVLYITHSNKMLRAQKRRSVRCECKIPAKLFIMKEKELNYTSVETAPGLRCILEDISEDGAMIRIGKKAVPNITIKLQFELEGVFIMMVGRIKGVEYNEQFDQSRIHFECFHVAPAMRNTILSFVYKILPEKQKEIFAALTETENDAKEAGDSENLDNNESISSDINDSINATFSAQNDFNNDKNFSQNDSEIYENNENLTDLDL